MICIDDNDGCDSPVARRVTHNPLAGLVIETLIID